MKPRDYVRLIEKAIKYPVVALASESDMRLQREGEKFLLIVKEGSYHLILDPKDNTFKCSHCGYEGSVIDLAKFIYDISFEDAVEILNEK